MNGDGAEDVRRCPSCGRSAGVEDRFCATCGTSLAADDGSIPTDASGSGDGSVRGGGPVDGPTPNAEPGPDETRTSEDGGPPGESATPDDPGWDDVTATERGSDVAAWQKRCPECDSVLVAQAVRCTDCGARQSDVDGSDPATAGTTDPPEDAGRRERSNRDADRRRGDANDGESRERGPRDPDRGRRERRRGNRPAPPPENGRRRTDAGRGEGQYGRERRTDAKPYANGREPRGSNGGSRDRRREPDPGTPHGRRHEPSRRDRDAALADRQAARRAGGEVAFEPTVPSERWWIGVLVPALLTFVGAAVGVSADPSAVAAGQVPWVGDAGGLLELGIVLTPTLAPFALYFDRKYVAYRTGRAPSAAYFLVAVPYLNLVVTGLYLWWRQQRLSGG